MVVIINYGTCVRKGNGWRSGEATLKNTARRFLSCGVSLIMELFFKRTVPLE